MPDLSRTFHMWWGKRGGSRRPPTGWGKVSGGKMSGGKVSHYPHYS